MNRAKSVEAQTPPEQPSQITEVIYSHKKSFVVSSSAISLSPPANSTVAQIYFAPADGLRRGLEKYRQFLRLVDRKASQHLQVTSTLFHNQKYKTLIQAKKLFP